MISQTLPRLLAAKPAAMIWSLVLLLTFAGAPGCGSSQTFLRSKKKDDVPLPAGVVAPREKVKQWRAIAKASEAPASRSAAIAQLRQAYYQETDPQLRMELLRILATLEGGLDRMIIERAAQDDAVMVRVELCRILSRQPSAHALPVLIHLANSDQEADVRLAAIKALGRYKDPEAARALVGFLRDRDPATQYLAAQSLKNTTGQNFGVDPQKWEAFVLGNEIPSQNRNSIADRVAPRF